MKQPSNSEPISTERPTPPIGNLIRQVNSNQYLFISEDIQSNNPIIELAPLPVGRIPDSFFFQYTLNHEIVAVAAKYEGKGLTISTDIITNPIIELSSTPDQFQLKPVQKNYNSESLLWMMARIKNVETGRYFTLDWNASVFKARNLSEKYSSSILLLVAYGTVNINIIYNYAFSAIGYPSGVGIVDQFLSRGAFDYFDYIKDEVGYKIQIVPNGTYLYVTEMNGEYLISAKGDVSGENCHFIIEEPTEPLFYLFNAQKNINLVSSIDFSPGGNNILEGCSYNEESEIVPFDGIFAFEEM